MQALRQNNAQMEHGQRRHFDGISTAQPSCIPMQIASMQASMNQDGRGSQKSSALRSDCWNSPLCPRNMPTNSLTQGMLPPSCGSNNSNGPAQQPTGGEDRSPPTEVYIQSPATTMASQPDQARPTMKRARTSNSMTEIKHDTSEDPSPVLSPETPAHSHDAGMASTGGPKEKRLPHHVIERRYRENLNSQIESLRAAVPSTSACLTLDMEDIGNANGTSAIRPMSKAAVIAHAAEYMRQLAAQNEEVERMNSELRVTVEALRRLVNCEDCGVVQQIVDAGA